MPDEGSFDLGDFECMRGVHGHEMLGLPVVFDAVDSTVEVDWLHACGGVMTIESLNGMNVAVYW